MAMFNSKQLNYKKVTPDIQICPIVLMPLRPFFKVNSSLREQSLKKDTKRKHAVSACVQLKSGNLIGLQWSTYTYIYIYII